MTQCIILTGGVNNSSGYPAIQRSLGPYRLASALEDAGYSTFVFEVDDLNQAEREVRSRGGIVISRTKDGWQGMEVLFAVYFIDKGEEQIVEYVKRR